tara:strand:+ start:72209 stop:72682 length:474 start_codon:yes stop_codon:yes gene_type:complete
MKSLIVLFAALLAFNANAGDVYTTDAEIDFVSPFGSLVKSFDVELLEYNNGRHEASLKLDGEYILARAKSIGTSDDKSSLLVSAPLREDLIMEPEPCERLERVQYRAILKIQDYADPHIRNKKISVERLQADYYYDPDVCDPLTGVRERTAVYYKEK